MSPSAHRKTRAMTTLLSAADVFPESGGARVHLRAVPRAAGHGAAAPWRAPAPPAAAAPAPPPPQPPHTPRPLPPPPPSGQAPRGEQLYYFFYNDSKNIWSGDGHDLPQPRHRLGAKPDPASAPRHGLVRVRPARCHRGGEELISRPREYCQVCVCCSR